MEEVVDEVKETLHLIRGIKSDLIKRNEFAKTLTYSTLFLKKNCYYEALKCFEYIWSFLKNDRICEPLGVNDKLKYGIRVSICYCNAKTKVYHEFGDASNILEELKTEYENFKFPYYLEVLHYFRKRNYTKMIDCINNILKMDDVENEIKSVNYFSTHVISKKNIPEFKDHIFKQNLEVIGLFAYMREYCIKTENKQEQIGECQPVPVSSIFERLFDSLLSTVKQYGLDQNSENYTDIRKKYKDHHLHTISESFVQLDDYLTYLFENFLNSEGDLFHKFEIYPEKLKTEILLAENEKDESKSDSKQHANIETSTDPVDIIHTSSQTQSDIKDEFTQTNPDTSNHLNDSLEETSLENVLKDIKYIKENMDFETDEYIVKQLNEELIKTKQTVEHGEMKNKEKVNTLIKKLEKCKEDNSLLRNKINDLNKTSKTNKTEINYLQDNIWELLQEKYHAQMNDYDKREKEYNFMINTLTNIKTHLNENTPFTENECVKYINLFQTECNKILKAKTELMKYFQNEIIAETDKYSAIQLWPSVPEMNLEHLSNFLENYKQTFALLHSFSLE